MKNKNLKKLSLNLVSENENFMDNLRHNLDMYVSQPDITIKDISESADIPFETLKGLIYGKRNDCNLSTAVKLAKAFGVSIDELTGANTLDPITKESVALCRNLPENSLYLVRWFVRRQAELYKENNTKGEKIISVVNPKCAHGHLEMSNDIAPLCIDHLSDNVKAKVFIGLKLACDHYMPYYSPYDILLIAADRDAKEDEHCAIVYYNKIFITKKHLRQVNGECWYEYIGLNDKTFHVRENEIDIKIGYIVDVYKPCIQ